jgi:hypothetical protein
MRGARGVPSELYNPGTRAQLQAAIPDSARCLVGPDESGCIYFYFLHKKGYGFSASEELFAPDSTRRPYIAQTIAGGARYLYTPDSALVADSRLRPYVRRRVQKTGNFYVLELQAAQP